MTWTLAQFGALGGGFVTPALAAAGAAAVTIPIAIHLLSRLRRRPTAWGAMRFLAEAYRRQRRRLWLEQWLLLLVRCLVVLVAGLALAGPLVGGAAGRLTGGLDATGRDLHLVLDDSLASAVRDASGATTLDRLRDQALALADAMGPEDRAALWRAGRPASPVIWPATLDREQLRAALASLEPGFSRSDAPGALDAVAQALDADPAAGREPVVALLSGFQDFGRGGGPAWGQGAAQLGQRARLWVARPAVGTGNVQLAALAPRRSVVVAQPDGSATLGVELEVRRFGGAGSAAQASVHLEARDADGRTLGQTTRRVRWSVGQGVTTASVELAVPGAVSAGVEGGRTLWLRAEVGPGPLPDALEADNVALGAVSVRRALRVAVLDAGSAGVGPGGAWPAARWVAVALSPTGGADTGSITVRRAGVGQLDPDELNRLDAVMLLRPDRVAGDGWDRLAGWVRGGGLLWVTPPSDPGVTGWFAPMRQALGLPWRVALEPAEPQAGQHDAGGEVPAASPAWRIAGTEPGAEALALLAGDLDALLEPVRVHRRIGIGAPGSEVWLTLRGGDPAAPNKAAGAGEAAAAPEPMGAVLVGRAVGGGAVLLMGVAPEPGWANLPTKPAFVPLLHEALRGVIGGVLRDRPAWVAGDRPALGPRYRGATRLERLTTGAVPRADAGDAAPLPLVPGDAGALAAEPVMTPGLYAAPDAPAAGPVIVNTDPRGGQTGGLGEAELGRQLDALGPWQWLDPADPAAALRQEPRVANLGWPLLWVLLGLAVLEMVLARLVSHAKVGRDPTLIKWARRGIGLLRPEPPAANQSPDRAAGPRGRAA